LDIADLGIAAAHRVSKRGADFGHFVGAEECDSGSQVVLLYRGQVVQIHGARTFQSIPFI
jgi:hypothetical protein